MHCKISILPLFIPHIMFHLSRFICHIFENTGESKSHRLDIFSCPLRALCTVIDPTGFHERQFTKKILIYFTRLRVYLRTIYGVYIFASIRKETAFALKLFAWFCCCTISGNMLKGSDVPWLHLCSVWYSTLSENIFIFAWQTDGLTIFTFCLSVKLLCCACSYQYLSHEIKVTCNVIKYKGDSQVQIFCTQDRSFITWPFHMSLLPEDCQTVPRFKSNAREFELGSSGPSALQNQKISGVKYKIWGFSSAFCLDSNRTVIFLNGFRITSFTYYVMLF